VPRGRTGFDSGGGVHLFDALTGRMLRTFDSAPKKYDSPAGPLTVSPCGRFVASACEGSILIWDVTAPKR
jgi:hypothetical protein